MPRLKAVERAEAVLYAQNLIATMAATKEACRLVRERYGVGLDSSKKIVAEARAMILAIPAEEAAETRKLLRARCHALSRAAFLAGQLHVCVRLLEFEARMTGTDRPERDQLAAHEEHVADDFESRSDEELSYYCEHGHWPEEARKELH